MRGVTSLPLLLLSVATLVTSKLLLKGGVPPKKTYSKTSPKLKPSSSSPQASPISRTAKEYECSALREYKLMKQQQKPENLTEKVLREDAINFNISNYDNSSYKCHSYETCLEAHLENFRRYGLVIRCNISREVKNIGKTKISFTHVPKSGGSKVREYLKSTREMKQRTSDYSNSHLSFYLQQRLNPSDFYFTILRNPVDMFISFFHYVSQHQSLPPKLMCHIGWESVFENKKSPLRFARLHYDVAEGDSLHFFVPTILNASIPVREWAPSRSVQALQPMYREVLHPWISDFPKKQYLNYLHNDKSFPERFRCQQYVEASVLLLERYAAVGTLERLSDAFKVFHHRANITSRGNVSRVVNRSRKSSAMSPEIEREIREELKAVMFCQTLLWRMAGEINAKDLECISIERSHGFLHSSR